ncbi:hypothetical protein JCGZ_01710 [Jatropha curcas]|uniref:HMA domain-containing protein n=1 Tax=Jatropha curcas TaxID=180498 RepID=A0A067JJI1_JATCU|nr:heavy metal-associated isoprenylated plant protein 16 [Jatropha curcas]KDP22988.1 hypothetical protein JCGZ_01710 [Jatropha curcas]
MKQKMVIRVCMNGDKSRSKALQIAVGIYGVESAALGEKDKNQLEVIGEGVDPVKLTASLRKKMAKPNLLSCVLPDNRMGYAELISVSAVGEKKEEPKKFEAPVVVSCGGSVPLPQYKYVCYGDPDPYPSSCSIL